MLVRHEDAGHQRVKVPLEDKSLTSPFRKSAVTKVHLDEIRNEHQDRYTMK
jgi:hypothetical protein